jgi:hypothetical protein
MKDMEAAARKLGLELLVLDANRERDFDAALSLVS